MADKDKKGKDKKKKEEATAITVVLANDKALGEIIVNSGYFEDAKERDQAIVKVLAGREVGLQPIESMTGIHIIQGKISFGANMMAAAVKKHQNYDYRVTEHTTKECVIDFYEIIYAIKGKDSTREKIGTSSFTMEEANKIMHWDKKKGMNVSLSSGASWKNYPKAMLFARAMSAGVRYYCPDVFGHSPVYVPEEMGATVGEDGEPIDITPAKEIEQFPEGKSTRTEPINIPEQSEEEAEKNKEFVDAEFDEVPEDEPEDDSNDKVRDIPDDLINDKMKPREAMKEIMNYAFVQEIGDVIRPVIAKHYKAWGNGKPYAYNIPEPALIKIIEELTGMKLKKAEKSKKCSSCSAKITEPEAQEQQNADEKPLCLTCYKTFQDQQETEE